MLWCLLLCICFCLFCFCFTMPFFNNPYNLALLFKFNDPLKQSLMSKNMTLKHCSTYTVFNLHGKLWKELALQLRVLPYSCLFSWRYNPLWLYLHRPLAGFSLLVFEVS